MNTKRMGAFAALGAASALAVARRGLRRHDDAHREHRQPVSRPASASAARARSPGKPDVAKISLGVSRWRDTVAEARDRRRDVARRR